MLAGATGPRDASLRGGSGALLAGRASLCVILHLSGDDDPAGAVAALTSAHLPEASLRPAPSFSPLGGIDAFPGTP